MSFSLSSNFFANARGLTFVDANGITWGFNPNTNQVTASYSGAGSAGAANPAANIGLVTVNGAAATFMRSDAAPALDQTIAPTWSGNHIFNPTSGIAAVFGASTASTSLTPIVNIVNTGGGYLSIRDKTNSSETLLGSQTGPVGGFVGTFTAHAFIIRTSNVARLTFASTGAATFSGNVGFNNATPPAQVTGWGTPTGASVQSNFSGAAATLAQCSAAIAKIITDLKALGLYGA